MLEARETKAMKDSAQFSAVLNAKAKAEATRDSLYQQIAIIKSIDDSRYLWSHLMYEISQRAAAVHLADGSHPDQPAAQRRGRRHGEDGASGDTANEDAAAKSAG